MYNGDINKFILFYAGSGGKEVSKFKRDIGCNQLLSQLNERKDIIDFVEFLRSSDSPCKLFVDSGAYSAYTKGKSIDIDDYINLINDIGDDVFIFAEVDKIPQVIDREPTIEEFSAAAYESWDNYLYMINHVNPKYIKKIMPVFHFQEDDKWLVNMLEYKLPDGSHIPYIGLAVSTIGSSTSRYNWLMHCFSIINKSSNPNVMTHAFGMTDWNVLQRVPLTSSDSSKWLQCAVHGQIIFEMKPVFIGDRSIHRNEHFCYMSPAIKDKIIDEINKRWFTMDELANISESRLKFNCLSIKKWEDNYKYTGSNISSSILFEE